MPLFLFSKFALDDLHIAKVRIIKLIMFSYFTIQFCCNGLLFEKRNTYIGKTCVIQLLYIYSLKKTIAIIYCSKPFRLFKCASFQLISVSFKFQIFKKCCLDTFWTFIWLNNSISYLFSSHTLSFDAAMTVRALSVLANCHNKTISLIIKHILSRVWFLWL